MELEATTQRAVFRARKSFDALASRALARIIADRLRHLESCGEEADPMKERSLIAQHLGCSTERLTQLLGERRLHHHWSPGMLVRLALVTGQDPVEMLAREKEDSGA